MLERSQMTRRIFLILTISMCSFHSHGATLICPKAETTIEKAICQSETLRPLNTVLSRAYDKSVASSGDPLSVQKAQQAWIENDRNRCSTETCFVEAFRKRIRELHSTYATTGEMLVDAATVGDIHEIRLYVSQGVPEKYLNTALMTATNWNQYESVVELLRLGASVHYAPGGQSALYVAAGRDTRIVMALVDAGADPNVTSQKYRYTPLSRAASNRAATFERLRSSGGYRGPAPNRLETVRLLVNAGANVNHIDGFSSSPLRNAMRVGNLEIARVLLEAGADVHQTLDDNNSFGRQLGNTILMETVAKYSLFKEPNAVKLLLEYGANPNDKSNLHYDLDCDTTTSGKCTWNGYTVLTFSASRGYDEIVQLLLDYGADATVPRQDGKSAIEIARESGHESTARILEAYATRKDSL